MAGLIPFNKDRSLFNTNRFDDFSNMLDDFFGDFIPSRLLNSDTFKLDVSETDKEYTLEAELPGVSKENVNLELDEDRLTISVTKEEKSEEKKGNYIHKERRYGSMKRSVYLANVNSENVNASFENGILKIVLPKLEKKDKSLKIDIK